MRFGRFVEAINGGHIMAAAALVVLPLKIVSWPSVTPVLAAAALVGVGLGKLRWSAIPPWLMASSALLVAYAGLSATWSLEPLQSLKLAAWLLGTFAAGLVLLGLALGLLPDERTLGGRALVVGFLAGLALFELMLLTRGEIIDYVRNIKILAPIIGVQRPFYFPWGFDTALSLVVLLVWPVVGVLLRRGRTIGALGAAGLALAVVVQGDSISSMIAFLAGIVVFFAARWAPRAATWAVGAMLALWIVGAPGILRPEVLGWAPGMLSYKASSLAHRLEIWQFTIGKIDERPLLGWGIDSARWMPGGHQIYESYGERLPLHPHDAALQLRLDLGLPGVLLGLCFLLGIMRAIYRRQGAAADTALALALMTSAWILAAVSYDLWHIWWLTTLWFAAIFLAMASAGAAVGSDRPGARARQTG